ncbi:hypothetical protein PLESTB_000893100 [Pleodorina starrii]|uniref:Uncharacterized protein n=1 Tax=Pleodorina starrii TaxID=330485 RepID=A0A9W6BMD8_9CHLO|nr:hypothetical protein PLESTB_000893100 [Pleodorina starrii]GLC67001.1 hypothetical protein PLESTF_000500900 [Pleodorina starrii]
MVTCVASSSTGGGITTGSGTSSGISSTSSSCSDGRADGGGGELLAALSAVLRLLPEEFDRSKAIHAVVDAGAVPALVHAVRTFTSNLKALATPLDPPTEPPTAGPAPHLPPADVRNPKDSTSSSATGAGATDFRRSDPGTSAWNAVSALEQLLVVGPKSAAPTAAKAASQALASGAVDALLPLLCAAPPCSQEPWRSAGQGLGQGSWEPWRVLRVLLVLERFSAPRCDVGLGAGSGGGGAAAVDCRAAGVEGGPALLRLLVAIPPAALDAVLRAARDLLATPHALTDSTAETLLLLFSELLATSTTTTTTTTITNVASTACAGADGVVAPPVVLLTPAQLRQAAPGLVAAALGILLGSSPGPDWAALLPCARERNLPSGSGTVRYAVQLEVAAAQLVRELLAWALAAEGGEGEDGGWGAWLPVAALAAALGQRWLERPGVFEALGDAGVRCLTLSLQLAPPAELWVGERVSDIPRLARKVRAMLERHKTISVWQLALVAALSAAAGTTTTTTSPSTPSATTTSTTTSCCRPQPVAPEAADAAADSIPEAPPTPAQAQAPVPEPPPQAAAVALELLTHLTSLMATVKLCKLAPGERVGILAGALNVAVACVAPQRAVRQGAAARLLLPSLRRMKLPGALAALAAVKAGDAAGGALGSALSSQRQALLKAMSLLHARLNLLLAAAMEPTAAAAEGEGEAGGAASAEGCGGAGVGGQHDTGEGEVGGGGASGAGGGGGGMEVTDLNGSFAGVDLAEMLPVMSAALRVGASAAAVIAEC